MFYLLIFLSSFTYITFTQEGQLEIVPTKEPDVFNIIYKGDMKWNVNVTLYNEKGRKRFEREVRDTDGFILPISLQNEKSGTYLVEIFTPVYDLQKEFVYLTQVDKLSNLLEVTFNPESRTITLFSNEIVDLPFNVYIFNEDGDQLVSDDVQTIGGKITRIYNLRGAPATTFQFTVMASGTQILKETFQ